MRIELVIVAIAGLALYNEYTDGIYLKRLLLYKKYYRIAGIAVFVICAYSILKINPERGKSLLYHAANLITGMPSSKTAIDTMSPLFDFTNTNATNPTQLSFMESWNQQPSLNPLNNPNPLNKVKRAVSETKKKYIASLQNWKCLHCKSTLDHTFEIDHKTRLEYGGGNNVENLIALCRNCHGKKTASENM